MIGVNKETGREINAVRWIGGNYADLRDFVGVEKIRMVTPQSNDDLLGVEIYLESTDEWVYVHSTDYVVNGDEDFEVIEDKEFYSIYSSNAITSENVVQMRPDKV